MGSVAVQEQSQVAEARRRAASVAVGLGANEATVSNVSIIATELANNLVRHAQGGELLVQPWSDADGAGVELLALDKGRGMADIATCFTDGYSTAGTPGTGLGAVKRLATFVDVWSRPGMGAALLVRVRLQTGAADAPQFQWGAVSQPIAGEEQCGDAWSVVYDRERAAFLVADGLGHGPFAAIAANAVVRAFQDRALKDSPAAAMQALHRAAASTRGAAASVASYRPEAGEIVYAGVGNIAGSILAQSGMRKMVSMSGTLGHAMGTPREFSYPMPAGALLVMNSDGLLTNWSLDSYPGLLARHPALIAGVLYRDFRRGRDDATVLVARRTA